MIEPVEGWEHPEMVAAVATSTTAYYTVQVPNAGVNEETRILCVLHGWGQNSRSILRRFAPLRDSNVLVVAPQGPHQFYLDMETKKVGFTWLTVYDRNRAVADIAGLIDTVLGRVQEDHGLEGVPFILGFSQGVSIAYRYHLLAGRPVRGIIACGGDIPPDVQRPLGKVSPLDVLLVHGENDAIVPPTKAQEAEGILQSMGHHVRRFDFDGGHELSPEAVVAIGKWVLLHP